MIDFNSERILEAVNEGLGEDGDLCLIIACRKCDAMFELNNQSVTMAIGMNIPFIEYIRFVQNSKCPVCNKGDS
jgi:hypothetical protein